MQWYGETVGLRHGETLVAWTANVQGWTLSHSMMEFSNELEVIEIIKRADDGEGLVIEAIFYDPEAFARRFRTQYRHNFLFPFGGTFGHSFGLSVFGVDGHVAYTIADGAPPRRRAQSPISTSASISTGTSKGSSAIPTALRACAPRSGP